MRALPSSTPDTGALAPRWAAAAMAAVFFTNGFGYASFVARIPAVRHALTLNDGELGTALFAFGAGALVSFPLAGRGTAARGARAIALASGFLFCLLLAVPALVPSFPWLVGALFLLGGASGIMDVSMNALAVEVEALVGKPIMSSLHGLWSAGGFAGAGLGSVFAKYAILPGPHLLIVAAMLLLVLVLARLRLPPSERHAQQPKPGFVRPEATLIGLGIIIFCSFLIEGAMADWTAVWLHDGLGASAALAALGYSAFSVTMMTMRFAGDRIVAQLGAERLLRRATVVAAVAFGIALAAGSVPLTLVAVMLIGVGVATVAPLVFGAAARRSHYGPGRGIAAMATLGYGGFLLGPALIGWIAQAASLRVALALLVALLLSIATQAHHLRDRSQQ